MSTLRSLPAALLLSSLALLGACSGTPYKLPPVVTGEPETGTAPPAPTAPAPAPTPRGEAPPATEPGVHSGLLAKADAARDRGQYDEALALLERAQRIDPDNAEIYLDMARTHYAAGDRARARTVAERGLLYCNGPVQCDALRAYLD